MESKSLPPSPNPPTGNPLAASPIIQAQQKIYLRTLPWLCLIAALCYIDRTNLAYASLSMGNDLGFTHSIFGLGSGLFFLGYSLAMIPSQFIGLKVGISRWLGIIVSIWGLVATLFSAVSTVRQFYLLRFLLGVAESGAFPATWYYLYSMLNKEALVLPYSAIEASVSIANVLSAPIAGLLLMLHMRGGLLGWQWMFILEGSVTIVTGILAGSLLTPNLQQSTFLTQSEKRAITLLQQQGKPGSTHGDDKDALNALDSGYAISWRLLRDSCTWKLLFISNISMLKNVATYGILFFLPSLVSDILSQSSGSHHHLVSAARHSQPPSSTGRGLLGAAAPIVMTSDGSLLPIFLSSIPFMATAIFALWVGHSSQKKGEKTLHLTLPFSAAALLFAILPMVTRAGWTSLAFIFLSLATAFTVGPNSVLNSFVPIVCPSHSVSIAMALYNSLSNLGGLVGPWLVGRLMDSGGFAVALPALSVFMVFASGLSYLTRSWRADDKGEGKEAGEDLPLLPLSSSTQMSPVKP